MALPRSKTTRLRRAAAGVLAAGMVASSAFLADKAAEHKYGPLAGVSELVHKTAVRDESLALKNLNDRLKEHGFADQDPVSLYAARQIGLERDLPHILERLTPEHRQTLAEIVQNAFPKEKNPEKYSALAAHVIFTHANDVTTRNDEPWLMYRFSSNVPYEIRALPQFHERAGILPVNRISKTGEDKDVRVSLFNDALREGFASHPKHEVLWDALTRQETRESREQKRIENFRSYSLPREFGESKTPFPELDDENIRRIMNAVEKVPREYLPDYRRHRDPKMGIPMSEGGVGEALKLLAEASETGSVRKTFEQASAHATRGIIADEIRKIIADLRGLRKIHKFYEANKNGIDAIKSLQDLDRFRALIYPSAVEDQLVDQISEATSPAGDLAGVDWTEDLKKNSEFLKLRDRAWGEALAQKRLAAERGCTMSAEEFERRIEGDMKRALQQADSLSAKNASPGSVNVSMLGHTYTIPLATHPTRIIIRELAASPDSSRSLIDALKRQRKQ